MKSLLFVENDKLNQTKYTQPAIFLVSQIAHTIFQQESPLNPALSLGHSLGEISALCVAGGIGFSDGIKLTNKRGEMMQKACEGKEASMMVIVGLSDKTVEEACESFRREGKSIWCANYNGEGQIVLAGKKSDLEVGEEVFKSIGAKRVLMLAMSVASHCPLLEPMCADFKQILKDTLLDNFSVPIISNATTNPYQNKPDAMHLLTSQLTAPVLYKQSILKIDKDIDMYIEFGHGSVLKGLNKRLSDKPTLCVSNVETLKQAIASISK